MKTFYRFLYLLVILALVFNVIMVSGKLANQFLKREARQSIQVVEAKDILVAHTNLPPDFSLLCNTNGKYAIMRTESKLVVTMGQGQVQEFTTIQQALNRAWDQFDYEHRPRETKPYVLPKLENYPAWNVCTP